MKFVDALKAVTQDDLREINDKIVETEKYLQGLKRAREIVKGALGMGPQRGGPRPAQRSSVPQPSATEPAQPTRKEQYREVVYKYLLANGPQSQAVLCKQCGVPGGSITEVLKHPWFTHTAKGVDLAK